jgi:methylenetetrahydrofolate dehydrogenase (NADP+)/methenyltetrahydrofolate cyclohydrolase
MRIVAKQAPSVGISASSVLLAENIKPSELRRQIEQLNNDSNVHAISLQSPIPKHLDMEEISGYILPEKDVEGTHPLNQGKLLMGKPTLVAPPALSVMKILNLYNINPAGRHVVVLGRTLFIGKPLQNLLSKADATVTICHSLTKNLSSHTRQAEILVTGVGKPGLITAEMVRPGAVVLDFGINYLGKGNKIVGDVDFEKVKQVAGAVTPMPGGTGPMTIISLFENVLKAARLQQEMKATEKNRVEEVSMPKGEVINPNGYLGTSLDLAINPSPVIRNKY